MTKKTRNWLIALSILAFPFVLFFGFLIFMEEPLPPVAPLPNPNGYDDLVNAGKLVTDGVGEYSTMKAAQLRELVGENTVALELARSGLSNECRVPVQYSESYISNHLEDLAGLKRLAQAFAAEGMLAEMNGRTNDAVQSFLDTVHLGIETMRGGVLIDGLVGIAIDAIGTSHVQTLIPHLDADTCRKTASTLESLDGQRQTWNEVIQQENSWSRRTFPGWKNELARLMERRSSEKAFQKSEQKFNKQQTQTRQLMLDLAARAFELDKGHPPASASDLVPEYLKAVPQDPVTGTNMVYSPR
jgi:hypothetical protein